MITLYIPTTTLNFNNILSSESVSPEAFYALREFGYSKWTSIAEENIKNVILLYDKPFSFKRPSEDQEDHPLIIEVNLDSAKIKEYAPHVYYCDQTIYLDPWNACFIFLSEKDKLTALSMSDSSLETKLIKLYRKKFKVNVNLPAKEINFEKAEIPLNKKGVEYDFTINRIKGLLYGYYIGANISSNKEDVSMINDFRELTNILSSIQSSENHSPSKPQEERLEALLNRCSILCRKCIENGNMLKCAAAQLFDLDKKLTRGKELLKPQSREIVIYNHHITKIESITNENERCLFQSWTDFFFEFASYKFNRNIGTINAELSDKLTYKAKDVFGTNWDGSFAKIFLNNLRRHIRGNVFEEEWNNGLLSSLAAVLTHGDDWHNLLLFMQSKGMFDYRLAYALYGVLNGFANLTRDFTDILYDNPSDYIASVYKEIYKQLFGKDLVVKSATIKNDSRPTEQHIIQKKPSLFNKLKEYIFSLELTEPQNEGLKRALDENGDNENAGKFFDILSKQTEWKRSRRKLQQVSTWLSEKQNIISKQRSTSLPDLFSVNSTSSQAPQSSKSIIYDLMAIKHIKDCDNILKEHTNRVTQMFEEFQQSYQNGYYRNHAEKYHRNNWDVIDHFYWWCFYEKNTKRLERTQEAEEAMDKLKAHLMNIYPDK